MVVLSIIITIIIIIIIIIIIMMYMGPAVIIQPVRLIAWMRKNNPAALRARFLVEFFDVTCQATTWKFQI